MKPRQQQPAASPMAASDLETPFLAPESQASAREQRRKPLTLLPLIALIFFEVSGGPFGTEDAVAAGGPLLVLAGFLILPLLWSVPEALITAELATAFPENSGYVAWVTAAFGPFWGFQEGFWSWLSGVTDNSIYPVMFADNLRLFIPALNGGWPRMAFVVALSLSLTYLNYRGLNVVGHTAMSTTVFIITPFLLLCALAAPHAQPANWLKFDPAAVQWSTYINIMFWNLNYWDSISCLAGEVDNPSRTFPRALLWAVLLVVLSYFLPTLAALGVSVEPADWKLGYYGKVAQQVGGNWLAWWIVLAAAASQIGQFQAEMSSDSYQLQGMAERGFLPKALARRSRHGTPTVGILLSSVGVVFLASFSFVDIVELLNAIYCLAELLEFAAYVWLRVAAPNLPRPYRVPLPTWGLVLMLTPAAVLLVVILALPLWERNYTTLCATGAAIVTGFILYPAMQLAKERGWLEYTDLSFEYAHATGAGAGNTYTITATGALNDDPTYAAEYVDVAMDDAGIRRTTGSSMDLGSLASHGWRGGGGGGGGTGPASASGSLGRSPRSPLGTWPLLPECLGGPADRGSGGAFVVGSAPAASSGAAAAGAVALLAATRAAGAGSSNGSGPAAAAAAAVAVAVRPDGSRLRPPDGAAGGFGSNQAGGAAAGAPSARRAAAARQLSSFKVRLSVDGGDGGVLTSSSPEEPSACAAGAAGADAAAAGISGQ